MRCAYRLSLTATFPLYPDTAPTSRCRALSLRCQPATSACISGSSTALRRAPFLLSPLSHTDGHVLPPTVAMPPTSQAPGTATLILRLRRYARPRPRCTVRLCTDFAPAVGQPLHSLRVSLRLRARAGRHTVLVQAHDKVPVAPCLHDTCRLL